MSTARRTPTPAIIALAEAFALVFAEQAARILADANARASNEYTTKSPPKGMSRKRFNEICRSLCARGDKRARKRGRDWVVDAEAIERAPSPRRTTRNASGNGAETPWSIGAALEEAGIRPQRQ